VLGIIYLSVSQNNVSMIEITPKEVKNSLTGYGGANKYQVREAEDVILVFYIGPREGAYD